MIFNQQSIAYAVKQTKDVYIPYNMGYWETNKRKGINCYDPEKGFRNEKYLHITFSTHGKYCNKIVYSTFKTSMT